MIGVVVPIPTFPFHVVIPDTLNDYNNVDASASETSKFPKL
jgi:hypothetical protein